MDADRGLALAWSGGKDAALALHVTVEAGRRPSTLVTTAIHGTVPHHGTPIEIHDAQAAALGIPLVTVEIPQPFDPGIHRRRMQRQLPHIVEMIFGDLCLQDLRGERERTLRDVGVRGSFPVWNADTAATADRILDAGIRAVVVAVDTDLAPIDLLGQEFDRRVVEQLEAVGADPCGENGEIHTVVFDTPRFDAPLDLRLGERSIEGHHAHVAVALDQVGDRGDSRGGRPPPGVETQACIG